jgi:hypothetical protein
MPYLELKEAGFFSFFGSLFHCLKHWVVGRRIGWGEYVTKAMNL